MKLLVLKFGKSAFDGSQLNVNLSIVHCIRTKIRLTSVHRTCQSAQNLSPFPSIIVVRSLKFLSTVIIN